MSWARRSVSMGSLTSRTCALRCWSPGRPDQCDRLPGHKPPTTTPGNGLVSVDPDPGRSIAGDPKLATSATGPGESVAFEPAAAPIHPRDRVPGWVTRAHDRWLAALPPSGRARLAVIIGLSAAVAAITIAAFRLVTILVDYLGVLAYAGLFVVNWVANGGLLVPIPGLRLVGWLMIVQQGGALDPLTAGIVGGVAMGLGQVSSASRPTPAWPGTMRVRLPSRLARNDFGATVPTMKARRYEATASTASRHRGAVLHRSPLTLFACGTAGALGMGFRVSWQRRCSVDSASA